MHTDAGTSLSRPPAAHRAILAPASLARQRAGGRSNYVQLPGEEVAAVRHAENLLVEFCGCDFQAMPWPLRPAAVKCAIGHLVTVALSNETVAELFLEPIAVAAVVTKTTLRKQVADRCWYFRNFHRLYANRDTRQQVVDELVRMLAA